MALEQQLYFLHVHQATFLVFYLLEFSDDLGGCSCLGVTQQFEADERLNVLNGFDHIGVDSDDIAFHSFEDGVDAEGFSGAGGASYHQESVAFLCFLKAGVEEGADLFDFHISEFEGGGHIAAIEVFEGFHLSEGETPEIGVIGLVAFKVIVIGVDHFLTVVFTFLLHLNGSLC